MRSKRKISIVLLAALSVLVLFVSGIIAAAYFTSNDRKDNNVIIANNKIDISEEFAPPDEQSIGNNRYKKKVSVTNDSNSPCYIRVYMDFSDSRTRNRSYFSNDWDGSTGRFYSAVRDMTNTETYVAKLNEVAPNWTFVPDDDSSLLAGYYYYKQLVSAGQSTEPLITYVNTHNETNDDIQQYDIIVYSESIQIFDMDGKEYDDYEEAWTDFLSKSSFA